MTDSANPVRYDVEGEFALICIDNPPVNASSQAVRAGLLAAMERFTDAPEKVAVIYGAGRTFVAGADIKEFGKTPLEPFLPASSTVMEARKSRWSACCTARPWAAGWRSRWGRITAWRCAARASACPRSRWASCPAPAARSACRG
jgi:enoyl-CoA hydratase/carnithine racemase